MQKITTALFDLGGTLMYDDPAAWKAIYPRADIALREALQEGGTRVSPEELYGGKATLLEYYYSLRTGLDEPGIERVLQGLLEGGGAPVPGPTIRRALDAMFAVTQENWRREEDAWDMLEALQQAHIQLGVVSNGSDDANARRLLDQAGLTPFFSLVLTSAAFGRRKPDPGIFQAALARMDAPAGESVMVGDNFEADIVGAASMGIHSIWIQRRLDRERITKTAQPPTVTVMSLREVPALLV